MNRIFVGGLKDSTSRAEIEAHFRKFGRIKKVFMPQSKKDKPKSHCKEPAADTQFAVHGYVFVKFYTSEAAQKALAVNSHEIKGHKIDVEKAYIIDGCLNESLQKRQLKLFFKGFPVTAQKGNLEILSRKIAGTL